MSASSNTSTAVFRPDWAPEQRHPSGEPTTVPRPDDSLEQSHPSNELTTMPHPDDAPAQGYSANDDAQEHGLYFDEPTTVPRPGPTPIQRNVLPELQRLQRRTKFVKIFNCLSITVLFGFALFKFLYMFFPEAFSASAVDLIVYSSFFCDLLIIVFCILILTT